MIAIVDYGMGNLRSVEKGFARVGFPALVTADSQVVERAQAVVLPGVGAFGQAMDNLRARGLQEPVKQAIGSGKPFLGICLGLELLFDESEEFGPVAGMGILPGRVVRFPAQPDLKIPHIGWSPVEIVRPAPIFEGVPNGSMFYFVHSYYVAPEQSAVVAGETMHGLRYASAVWKGNLFACQFHPEKSGAVGLRMLENFGRLAGGTS